MPPYGYQSSIESDSGETVGIRMVIAVAYPLGTVGRMRDN